jgi:hypothetical protein
MKCLESEGVDEGTKGTTLNSLEDELWLKIPN